MRNSACFICFAFMFLAIAPAPAQPRGPSRSDSGLDAFIARMMAFDANHDGNLTRNEITDERLLELFDRADANHDGVVTRAELKALYITESAWFMNDRPPDHGPGPRPGPGRGGPPPMLQQPGQVLSESAQRLLNLSPEQKAGLAELQHDVDMRLDTLLTAEQKARLKRFEDRRPFR
jgi:hypothetical protein